MKLSRNFSRQEFACKCGCGFATVDVKLIELLEAVRKHFDKPVTITSGCRCSEYNARVGGAKRSKHMEGLASDIVVKDVEPLEVYRFVDAYTGGLWCGLAAYKNFTHIDSRQTPWRKINE